MSTIVVFGITGYAGGHIADELLQRGHEMIGVARNPTSVTRREQLEVRTGSLYDTAFLTETAAGADTIVVATRPRDSDEHELVSAVPALLTTAAAVGARLGFVGGAASLLVAEGGPRVLDAPFRLGTDILITDADGSSDISGADYASAFADEIEKPAHHQTRFTVGY